MQIEITPEGRAAMLRYEAREICRAQEGYGSPHYRGDPYEAVAKYQEADRLDGRGACINVEAAA